MSTETDCLCKHCGSTWFYNEQDTRDVFNKADQAKANLAIGAIGVLSGDYINAMYQQGAAARTTGNIPSFTQCPSCGSRDIQYTTTEVYNFFLDDPLSPIFGNQKPLPNVSSTDETGGPQKSKIVAGLLALGLGSIGAHKFYLGYTIEGLIMLGIAAFGFIIGGTTTGLVGDFAGLLCVIVQLVGAIEGIFYLVKKPDVFQETYVHSHRGWF